MPTQAHKGSTRYMERSWPRGFTAASEGPRQGPKSAGVPLNPRERWQRRMERTEKTKGEKDFQKSPLLAPETVLSGKGALGMNGGWSHPPPLPHH